FLNFGFLLKLFYVGGFFGGGLSLIFGCGLSLILRLSLCGTLWYFVLLGALCVKNGHRVH
ncbi:MAG: hypothetical protein ACI8X3_001794, partial [Saprospiraceae bacterium]